MVLKENGESSSKDTHYEGGLLMVRRLMSNVIEEETESQRETIFHLGNLCPIIIDGVRSANVTSLRLVEKLALPTLPHPMPYKLQWLSEKRESIVDRKVTHDGVSNRFTFVHSEEKMVLKLLSLKEVSKDQVKMRKKRKKRKKKQRLKRPREKESKKIREKSKNDMLEECKGIFPKEMPQGLPPLRGIKHHIDLIIGASLIMLSTQYQITRNQNNKRGLFKIGIAKPSMFIAIEDFAVSTERRKTEKMQKKITPENVVEKSVSKNPKLALQAPTFNLT
ncbi:hypothetical protein CR513_22894, partial [Mucuna pruriens]